MPRFLRKLIENGPYLLIYIVVFVKSQLLLNICLHVESTIQYGPLGFRVRGNDRRGKEDKDERDSRFHRGNRNGSIEIRFHGASIKEMKRIYKESKSGRTG